MTPIRTTVSVHVDLKTRVDFEINLRPAQRVSPELTIDLLPMPADAMEFTCTFALHNLRRTKRDTCEACGAGLEYVAEQMEGHPAEGAYKRLRALAKRWHLNGLKAGSRAQESVIASMRPAEYPESHYDKACRELGYLGLYADTRTNPDFNGGNGYKYGSAWLYEPLPDTFEAELNAILADLRTAA